MGGGETHKHLVRNSPPNVVKTNLTLSVEFQYTDGDSQPSSLPFLFDCFTSECAQRVSKPEGNWENTSCFKTVYLVPLALELMDLMLPSVDSVPNA